VPIQGYQWDKKMIWIFQFYKREADALMIVVGFAKSRK
jgi:hypothetical protein